MHSQPKSPRVRSRDNPQLPTQTNPFAPLLTAIGSHALPDALRTGAAGIVVARRTLSEMSRSGLPSPELITMSPRKMLGARQAIRERQYNRSSHKIARWPKDELAAASIPLLICVVGGRADLRMGEYVLHCEKGSFVVVPPGMPYPEDPQPHLDKERQENGWCDLLWLSGMNLTSGLQCWLCHSRGSKHPRQESGEGGFVTDPRTGEYFHAFFDETVNASAGGGETSRQLSQSLLIATLCAVHREIEANRCFYPGQRTVEARPGTDKKSAIGEAQAYMASHLYRPLTIDTVAHSVYMSRAQFTRRFRAETGKSFTEFLTDLRLAEAKNLLRETQWSVQAISRMVGLASSSHLRKLLHRHEGALPTELRREARDNKPGNDSRNMPGRRKRKLSRNSRLRAD